MVEPLYNVTVRVNGHTVELQKPLHDPFVCETVTTETKHWWQRKTRTHEVEVIVGAFSIKTINAVMRLSEAIANGGDPDRYFPGASVSTTEGSQAATGGPGYDTTGKLGGGGAGEGEGTGPGSGSGGGSHLGDLHYPGWGGDL